jgi:hypothetical protein
MPDLLQPGLRAAQLGLNIPVYSLLHFSNSGWLA